MMDDDRVEGDAGLLSSEMPLSQDRSISGLPPDVSESEIQQLFEKFITTFRVEVAQPVEHRNEAGTTQDWDAAVFENGREDVTANPASTYLVKLRAIFEQSRLSEARVSGFPIDMQHLLTAQPRLMRYLIRYPGEVMVLMDESLQTILAREYADYGVTVESLYQSRRGLRVSLYNHPRVKTMRDLDPKDIETLVAVRGVVIRASNVIPEMRVAVFRCSANRNPGESITTTNHLCNYEERVPLLGGQVQEPTLCPSCGSKFSMDLVHDLCQFGNKQLLKLQEAPESIPEGETPHTILAYVFENQVDCCKPGDHVEVCGIIRAAGVRQSARQRALKAVYRIFLDVSSARRDFSSRYLLTEEELRGPAVDAEMDSGYMDDNTNAATTGISEPSATVSEAFSPEMVERFNRIAASGEAYKLLVKSLAPNIWENDEVKKGRASRSDIHVLLCGDPSTAKSQLLKYVHTVAPRGVYTCGRGSSAVGLTASVSRDPETREFVLESGAIILSDRGICCIDEFDKMDDAARTILHEVLEQQSVSVAKAGIVCSLNARTALLASANPVASRYDATKTVVENLNLPASLLSRFDLIYLMLDCPNEKLDKALASHICGLFGEVKLRKMKCSDDSLLDRETLAAYISYARKTCFPRLGPDVKKRLADAYVELRSVGEIDAGGRRRTVTATPRQLEALIRVSEALAKMELKTVVDVAHVEEALRLMRVSTYSSLVDPSTGKIDFQQLAEGASGETRARRRALEEGIVKILDGKPSGLDKTAIAEQVSAELQKSGGFYVDANSLEYNLMLRELEECGRLSRLSGGRYTLNNNA